MQSDHGMHAAQVLKTRERSPLQAIPLMEFESAERCTAAAFTRSGSHIAAGYDTGMQRLFDLDAVNIRWSATHHAAPVMGVASNRDSSELLGVSRDGVLSIAAAKDGSLQRTANLLVEAVHGHPLDAFAASPMDAAIAAVAWRQGLAVFAPPWHGKDMHILAKHEVQPALGALMVCSALSTMYLRCFHFACAHVFVCHATLHGKPLCAHDHQHAWHGHVVLTQQ